jgi:hypothetical protein
MTPMIENRSPRMRPIAAFAWMTPSLFLLLRGFGNESNAHLAFVSVFTGAVFAGLVALRDRGRSRAGTSTR